MKVAIVGAGICGLYLAWKLAKGGEEVTVFEKRKKIGQKACSGLFSEKILEFIPESQKLIKNQINYCLIHFPKKTLNLKFSQKFLVMNRFELDNLVANLAQKAGAKILLNHNITQKDLVILENNFDKIVGTDGATSEVRRYLKLSEPKFLLGIQNYIALYSSIESKNDNDFVEVWPTKNGFIWKIFRNGGNEYGIIEKPKLANLLFRKFLKENNLKLGNLKSALIPQGLVIPKNQKITLCGDAAGLTKPWSGGGVIWGLTAADLLLKNFPDFLKYKKQVQRFFSLRIFFSKMATRLVYLLGFKTPFLLPKKIKIESDFLI